MNLSNVDLRDLADLAIAAATEAGQMIARSRPHDVQHKTGGASPASQVVTEIDRRSEDIILETLHPSRERFELGLLTEEQEDDGGRLTADHFWCIDPLDGTLPFVEGARGYAVSIALVANDGTPRIGVVYDPVAATLFHAVAGGGVFRDNRPWSVEAQQVDKELSVLVDRSFLAGDGSEGFIAAFEHLAHDLGLSGARVEASSGAVMNACGVLAAPPACYVKFPKPAGGGSLWDFAATACIFDEAGAVATDIHGDPLDLNRPDSTFMNHRGVLFATNDELASRIRAMARAGG